MPIVSDLSLEELKQLKEVVNAMLDYSNAAIIRNNFIKAFYDNTVNGRLYGSFKLFGTKTFRLTSSAPNLLNMPSTGSVYAKPIKQCLSTDKNHLIYQVDFSALEDRVIANLSRDENKCAIFTQGIDGHCLNAYYYFTDEVEAILPREEGEDLYVFVKRFKREVDNGNKALKAIRQKSKPVSFGLNYGAYPEKVASSIKCSLEQAENIFHRYHDELYKGVDKMRSTVLAKAKSKGYIPLGLGCRITTDHPEKEIRTVFNACSQFWSILSLLSLHRFNEKIAENHLEDKVEVISSIYDALYIHINKDAELVKWVNNTIIPIMTADFLEDQIVHNEAVGEIGYNWYDTAEVPNGASLEDIEKAMASLEDKCSTQQ